MAACAMAACAMFWGGAASAQTQPAELQRVMDLINQQEARLDAQERQLEEQQRQLGEQRQLIERQRRELLAMGAVSDADLGDIRGAGMPSSALNFNGLGEDEPLQVNRQRPLVMLAQVEGGSAPQAAPASTPSDGPVGQAPTEQPQAATVDALPEGQNALLGAGRLVIEPSFEYSRSSSNRFVFRGVEIVTGVQIGLLEVNDAARDTLTAALAARYAVTDRLELEVRVPYIYRSDRVTTLAQQSTTTMQTFELSGGDIGDVEMSARYQLNNGANGAPIFVVGARVKSDSGLGPFDLERDSAGVSTELATGSGFWAVQGSVSMLYPTDPAVIFSSLSYNHNIAREIGETYGTVTIGEVDPGDSISMGFGFGFALNNRFSYSLGYSHSYVFPTTSELNELVQESTELQVGSVSLGMSFRLTERQTLSTSVDIGVTEDAPDVRVAFRAPFRW
jgi:hypothetical protein